MAAPDKMAQRFGKREERKKAIANLVSPDDPPLPDAPVQQARKQTTVGRNDPCPCGSGQKYKKCCGAKG